MFSDLRFAVRQLLKQPGFTVVAVVALALGLGANTAIFSAINTLFLCSLPFPEAENLVRVWGSFPDRGLEQANVSYPRFEALRDGQQAFAEFAAQAFTGFTLTGRGDPENLQAQRVTGNFFSVLGVQPVLGRTFRPEEDRPGGAPVVLLSQEYWKKHFGGDASIVGQSLTLNGTPHTVIGILPSLPFPYNQNQVWATRVFDEEGISPDLIKHGTGYLTLTARLKPGATLAQANEQMKTLSAGYGRANPDKVDANAGIFVVSFQEDLVGGQRPMFLTLLAAVGLVLLIACANVANLFLVRFTARRKEIALRTALGATRGRIVAQFLTESLLTTFLAGGLGVLLAHWCVALLGRIGADFIPRVTELSLDGRVLAFSLLLSLLTGLLLGLVPAWQASSPDVNDALKESSRGSTGGRSTSRFRSALFVGQVALSLVLLAGAGLLVDSFVRLQKVPTGFTSAQVAVINLGISPGQYPDAIRQGAFYEQFLARLATMPGIEQVSVTDGLPAAGNGFSRSPFALEGTAVPPVNERPIAVRSLLSPGFFATLGIPVKQGRDFSWRDRDGTPNVVIINQIMAKRLFPNGENPVGRRLITGIQSIPREIVGVVGDVRSQELAAKPQEEMYYPVAQLGALFMNILVRTPRAAAGLRADIKVVLHDVDASIPPPDVQSYDELLSQSISDRRLVMGLLGGFSVLAMFLAGLGIYSVIAYGVAQRTGEFGVRLALGAAPSALLLLVLREGLKLTLIGLGIGLVASVLLTRLLHSLLFEVSATDPIVLGGVSLFLGVVALVACWLPARRAAKVDPMVALRAE